MTGLLLRLRQFYDALGTPSLVGIAVVLLLLLLLTLLNKRWWLLLIYISAMMFSGYTVQAFDAGSTLLRWVIMFMLAITAARGVSFPGIGAVLLGLMAMWGILMSSSSISPFYSLQQAGLLLILAGPMAAAMSNMIRTREDILKLLNLLLVVGGLFLVLGIGSMGQLRGARFSGITSSATLFVITGGILLPIALWGAMVKGNRWRRIYCGCLVCGILMLCFVSGQRTGTLAGLVSCIPLAVARLGIRKIFVVLLVGAIGVATVVMVLDFMPEQKAFVIKRFTSADTTGRVELWRQYYGYCMEGPWSGYGMGATGALPMGPHNAFLSIWYDQGLLGLFLFVSALLVLIWQSIRLLMSRKDEVVREMGRLFLGLMLGAVAAAFFEAKLDSPSNFAIFMVVAISVVLTRLRAEWQQVAEVVCDENGAYPEASSRGPDMLLVQHYDG